MIIDTPYLCTLTVLRGGKGIPYGPANRDDGSINHGFRSLKGNVAAVNSIPEVRDDPALERLLRVANAPETMVFTVGCVSGTESTEQGFSRCGYVEFAINDADLAADATNYFKMFYTFSSYLEQAGFREQVAIQWRLLGAHFLNAGTSGMTCDITINTALFPEERTARRCWESTIATLTDFIMTMKGRPRKPLVSSGASEALGEGHSGTSNGR